MNTICSNKCDHSLVHGVSAKYEKNILTRVQCSKLEIRDFWQNIEGNKNTKIIDICSNFRNNHLVSFTLHYYAMRKHN